MPMFDGDDLMRFVEQATWLTLNDYEAQLMQERTGLAPGQLTEFVEAVFVTRGGEGSDIHTRDGLEHVPALRIGEAVDPTGCGDAYRAGLLHGLMQGWDLVDAARLASLMGGVKIESHGTQNHRPGRDELAARLRENYAIDLSV